MNNGPIHFPPFIGESCMVCTFTVSLFALSLSGCLNWSGDVSRYRSVLDGQHRFATPAFAANSELTVVQALRLANADNEAIASSGEDYVQALAEKMRQAGTLLPTLTLAPSYSISSGAGNNGTLITGTNTAGPVNTADYQLSVPLNASLTGSLTNASNAQAAAKTADQRAQLLLNEQQTILLETAQSYYSVIKAEQQSGVYENSVRLKSEKVRDQATRLKLGNVRPLDLAQTESDLSATRASLTQARTDAANARSALARLMGVAAVNGPLNDSFQPPPTIQKLEQQQRQAAVRRQDLLASDRAIDSAKSSLSAAIYEYFPSVTLRPSYFLYNDPTSLQTWSSVFSVNIPLFSAFSIEADIRKAQSLLRQAVINQSQTKRQVLDDVSQCFQNFQGSRQKIADLKVEVEAAQRAFDLSERAYQLGSVSNLDRLTQQDSLLTAQLSLVSEQLNLKTYYLAMLRAKGGMSAALQEAESNSAP